MNVLTTEDKIRESIIELRKAICRMLNVKENLLFGEISQIHGKMLNEILEDTKIVHSLVWNS